MPIEYENQRNNASVTNKNPENGSSLVTTNRVIAVSIKIMKKCNKPCCIFNFSKNYKRKRSN